MILRPEAYSALLARTLAKPFVDGLNALGDQIGSKLPGKIGGALQSGLQGYLESGPVGAVLGFAGSAAKSIFGAQSKIGALFDQASAGAAQGSQVAQIGASLGIRTSQNGGALGGALGAVSTIPGGQLIGSIIGSIIGGLFHKTKTGVATITGVDSDPRLSGNNNDFKSQAGSAAGGVQSALQKIADQLGGEVGNFAVSIGIADGKYYVDPKGKGNLDTRRGALGFGTDGTAAVTAAVFDAISDGGVTGLSAAVQRALHSSSDLDRSLREALKVQQVEDIVGGLGATIGRQFKTFEAQAKERVRIAGQYGFDVLKIEEKNAEDRKALADKILSDRVGSLQSLLKDLTTGNLFEGSASDRRQALIGQIATAQTDATAGKDGAAATLADLTRQLVETSKEAFGTAGPEYSKDRASAISSAEQVIALENARIKAAQDAALGTNARLDEANRLANEGNDLLARLVTQFGSFTLPNGYAYPASAGGGGDLTSRTVQL